MINIYCAHDEIVEIEKLIPNPRKCDITSKLDRLIRIQDFKPTPDKLGYYRYNDTYNAYFEILSYDKRY
ncbi:hypothetical protein SPSIL_054480 [Sporomusa silvacetica DSM 10669]|uniref:Uncharacterized protein n=1 Tax=Sporomusa silvacetica DSM 10669 TaxID=1123289 RepID=A0ABZ3IU83_9FIRM|nr:hypothetical protein SPSIL_11300 [Sporomusa silvacetica DSM 10669]